MANVNIDEKLHSSLWNKYKQADKIEYPSFKNFIEKSLSHSLSCAQFARKDKNNIP